MQNFRFETYPEFDTIQKIETFDEKINEIEENFKNEQRNIRLEDLLKGDTKENLKNIGFTPEKTNLFKGVYVFYSEEKQRIEYIGISRKIIDRLRQHAYFSQPNSASLAYLMLKKQYAKKDWVRPEDWNKQYFSEIEIKNKFQDEVREFQAIILSYKVTFVEFDNDFEMALFEIYASIKLQTYWNTFITH